MTGVTKKPNGALIVNSDESLQRALGAVRATYAEHRYVRINIKTGKQRSLDHNAISWVWYGQIARELVEDTVEGVHCECKLRFGVPILRADDEEFRAIYDSGLKHLTYEQKLKAMEFMPVTSHMTVDQMKRYCDAMQKHYSGRGVVLEYPPEDEPKRVRTVRRPAAREAA